MHSKNEQFKTLRDLYSIKGNGIAEVKLNKLKGNEAFKGLIHKLSSLEINLDKSETSSNST